MSSVYPILAAARDKLAALAAVSTCKIGFEANMTPADYPMVRIVPSKIGDEEIIGKRGVEVLVYFGQPVHEFSTDLHGQWQSLLTMESQIIDALQSSPAFFFAYRDTFLDEDRIEAYKVLAIRGTLS